MVPDDNKIILSSSLQDPPSEKRRRFSFRGTGNDLEENGCLISISSVALVPAKMFTFNSSDCLHCHLGFLLVKHFVEKIKDTSNIATYICDDIIRCRRRNNFVVSSRKKNIKQIFPLEMRWIHPEKRGEMKEILTQVESVSDSFSSFSFFRGVVFHFSIDILFSAAFSFDGKFSCLFSFRRWVGGGERSFLSFICFSLEMSKKGNGIFFHLLDPLLSVYRLKDGKDNEEKFYFLGWPFDELTNRGAGNFLSHRQIFAFSAKKIFHSQETFWRFSTSPFSITRKKSHSNFMTLSN